MIYIWEPQDLRPGRRLFFKRNDVTKVCIGKLELAEQPHRDFVLITEGVVSVPYSATELCAMFNENGSIPE